VRKYGAKDKEITANITNTQIQTTAPQDPEGPRGKTREAGSH
jgi:hypothetical protein